MLTVKKLVYICTNFMRGNTYIQNYIIMNKKLSLYVLAGAAIVLTGCNKKMSPFASEYFSTDPTPLEVVGDAVPATITANVPQKFFKKNAEVTVTPYLLFGDSQKVTSKSYTFQGEKVKGNNPVVSYDNGGTVSMPASFAYTPEMLKSDLYLDFNVTQGKKTYVLPAVKVGEGVLATATLADATTVTPSSAADKYQRVINEKYNADLMFLINKANIRASELEREGGVGDLNATIAAADSADNKEIEGVHVSSFASPDGGVEFNTKLSEKREQATVDYLKETYKKENVEKYGELTSEYTPQDWEGFQRLVSESNIQDKDLILSVLSMYKDPEEREREIRNISSVFEQLAEEILPQLRYSRITASINTIGRSDDEIKAQFKADPTQLSIDELLYCATLTDNVAEKEQIYAAAAKQYPNDYRGFNNLGMTQYVQGNYDDAKANFEKAAKLNSNSPEAKMNLGLLKMKDKDYEGARQAFGSAADAEGLNEAMGVYYLKQGDYQTAEKAFGDSKTNNAALAQILNKNYSKAKSTLEAVKAPNATTYYMLAVVAARTNNEQAVYANLRKAASLDSSMKERAAVDKEFANYNVANL